MINIAGQGRACQKQEKAERKNNDSEIHSVPRLPVTFPAQPAGDSENQVLQKSHRAEKGAICPPEQKGYGDNNSRTDKEGRNNLPGQAGD